MKPPKRAMTAFLIYWSKTFANMDKSLTTSPEQLREHTKVAGATWKGYSDAQKQVRHDSVLSRGVLC